MRKMQYYSTVAAVLLLTSAAHAATVLPKPDPMGVPASNLYDYGVMGPPASPEIVERALKGVDKPLPAGPYQPTWASIADHYTQAPWFSDAKFGIFIHWGVYSAAAHGNEWYEKHMYAGEGARWHEQHFGPQDKVGYKDLIPLFTAKNWHPDQWAKLFRAAGAKYVIPTAEHHDNFALWDSKVTPFNAVKMGPHRDLIGDLEKAVHAQGLKFGVSNHGMENFTFVNPDPALDAKLKSEKADLYDPKWADFYHVADRSNAAMAAFLADWVNRNLELIDDYHPDILWWDNGVNLRVLDPLKKYVAAYYYNRGVAWGQPVSLSTKYIAMAPSNDDTQQIGSLLDFEKVGKRSPTGIRRPEWQVDDTIGDTSWGYVEGLKIRSAATIIPLLIDTVAKGGNYVLNISPRADGVIPDDQQQTLLGIGKWLSRNGEAIYATRPWTQFGEGDWRFTRKDSTIYAIALTWPDADPVIKALGTQVGQVASVALIGGGPVAFTQNADGLHLTLPAQRPDETAWAFRVVMRQAR
ncbi:alpha-L-fucosidase [Asticcacaulis sp. EMRT-3]|uniref:alpha-L-fucosidase n=1 Tax=Asticcacaulis sp. EMRT-3 TaxID=3040349 RepID=UPI0024AEB80F|nr:alpha-L-fucosidase [Asticcacaulis sp. EMRT-3]MDI7776439.1 alpha-L-fucosidase [Asticcacaulis sp. EMRT-3]